MLDPEVRRWLLIHNLELFSDGSGAKFNQTAVKKAFGAMLTPTNYAKASIMNNLFLRFPDMAPNFVFRDLKTEAGYAMYEKVRFNIPANRPLSRL